jgi:hypothetical protein
MADGGPITILFTDVQGSTQLRARHGDRVADEILHDHEAIVRRAIGAYGGAEVAFLGDGFMATFGTPAAGLSCAIAIQQALQSYGRDNADRRIRVRIGLHHGQTPRLLAGPHARRPGWAGRPGGGRRPGRRGGRPLPRPWPPPSRRPRRRPRFGGRLMVVKPF